LKMATAGIGRDPSMERRQGIKQACSRRELRGGPKAWEACLRRRAGRTAAIPAPAACSRLRWRLAHEHTLKRPRAACRHWAGRHLAYIYDLKRLALRFAVSVTSCDEDLTVAPSKGLGKQRLGAACLRRHDTNCRTRRWSIGHLLWVGDLDCAAFKAIASMAEFAGQDMHHARACWPPDSGTSHG